MNKPILAITMGDPAGVGPEIILKALADIKSLVVIIACEKVMRQEAKNLEFSFPIIKIDDIGPEEFQEKTLYLIDPTDPDLKVSDTGHVPSAAGGKMAAECIVKAVELALADKVGGIITAPISKEALHMAGYNYPGHTEFLAELTHAENFAMMLAGGEGERLLRVVPVTTHLALGDVPAALKEESILAKLRVLNNWLQKFAARSPRIAVCALNPHAGDGGIFGNEEKNKIEPALKAAEKEGICAEGPYPADSLFARIAQAAKKKKKLYDAIVAMYHDQALIPLKMTAFGEAVNITLGLPIIRTSVDHGTAYDIAGKNLADPASLLKAIHMAADLAA